LLLKSLQNPPCLRPGARHDLIPPEAFKAMAIKQLACAVNDVLFHRFAMSVV
jgi:hypothetical protein